MFNLYKQSDILYLKILVRAATLSIGLTGSRPPSGKIRTCIGSSADAGTGAGAGAGTDARVNADLSLNLITLKYIQIDNWQVNLSIVKWWLVHIKCIKLIYAFN